MLLKFAKPTLQLRRSAADSNQMLQLGGPELLSFYLAPHYPQAPGAPVSPLGLLIDEDVLGVRVSRLGESECLTPSIGWDGGSGFKSFHGFRQWLASQLPQELQIMEDGPCG